MNVNTFPIREPASRPASPPWGRMVDEGKSSPVVRFVLPGQTHSFPYHVFLWWRLEAGDLETLTIQAGAMQVTVRGRRLAVIRDALESGRLELVQATSERGAVVAAPPATWVETITVQPPPGPR